MNNPTPFINSPPPRRGPSRWAIGGATCLVVLILGAVVIFAGAYSVLRSPGGKTLRSTFGSAIQRGQEIKTCDGKMLAIHDAIVRYHTNKGVYPKNLKSLVPDFLPDPATLHCPSDPASDPGHVTFLYAQPSEDAPASTPILAFTTVFAVTFGGVTQTSAMTIKITLGGEFTQSQTITQNGKVIRQTSST